MRSLRDHYLSNEMSLDPERIENDPNYLFEYTDNCDWDSDDHVQPIGAILTVDKDSPHITYFYDEYIFNKELIQLMNIIRFVTGLPDVDYEYDRLNKNILNHEQTLRDNNEYKNNQS